MRHVLVFLFYGLVTVPAFSQTTKCIKSVPFFSTYNPEKLSHKLTDGLDNDSAKVFAIYCWITHHIKYDFKKSEVFDYSRVPVKRILCKRKAICTGYSDLFNELCKHANIVSTGVPGYIKNRHVDLNDKFYTDEHIWNAALINDKWKLFDACWDAGYVKSWKPTLWGHIKRFFSGSEGNQVKYKPHFVFYPTDDYFFKNGDEFLFDHLPSIPLWQLSDQIISIEQYEMDSSFYLSKNRFMDKGMTDFDYKSKEERLRVCKMTQEEMDKYYGPVSYDYNYKNHYPMAFSKSILAFEIYKSINFKSDDTIQVLKLCDSLLNELSPAKLHFDSTLYYLDRQRTELRINNHCKYDTLRKQNTKLIASTKRAEINIKSTKKINQVIQKTIKRLERTNETRYNRLLRNEAFAKAKPRTTYTTLDSLNAAKSEKCLRDTLTMMNKQIRDHFIFLDSLDHVYTMRLNEYSTENCFNIFAASILINDRFSYLDDLDLEIRTVKDSIMKYKFGMDSMLLGKNGKYIIREFANEARALMHDFRFLYNYHKLLAAEYVKLKRYKADIDILSRLYANNIFQYKEELHGYSIDLNRIKVYFEAFEKRCKRQRKYCRWERGSYMFELGVERMMFSARTRYINRHYNALAKLSKKKLANISKMRGKAEQTILRLSKN